jgi:hypothetical protein
MNYYDQSHNCLHCYSHIDERVHEYSATTYGFTLCISCQKWYKSKINKTTPETIKLYFSLKKRGVPAKLEKFDGHKTIDIAVIDAKVNIEVDGPHHNSNPKQALADLQRTYYAFKKGYLTLRIPNSLVRENLDQTADYITEFLNLNKKVVRSNF